MGARVMLIVVLLAVAACGEAPEPRLSASITISAALSELVDALEIYVFGRRRSDNVEVPCTSLTEPDSTVRIEPTDPRLETLAYQRIGLRTTNSYTLIEVAAGKDRVIFVAAFDVDTLVGRGCEENKEVLSGESVSVSVHVFPVQ